MLDVLIIGGGAAGFFTAIQTALANPKLNIAILERGKEVLTKVKVSGGGRCNVAHAEFDPRALTTNYPRGERELLGPFHTFSSAETMAFFQERNVPLKIEADGRIFPESNTSQSVIDCFVQETDRLGITVLKNSSVIAIQPLDCEKGWQVQSIRKVYQAQKVVVASGSNPKIWELLKGLGHSIVPPVPSLFTFNIKDDRIIGIPGVSTTARVMITGKSKQNSKITVPLKSLAPPEALLQSEGPVLITHWGLSGPAILKLSAWGAVLLNTYDYKFKIRVNWLPDFHENAVLPYLLEVKDIEAKKTVLRTHAVALPRRLWINLVKASGISETTKWADISKNQLQQLAQHLCSSEFQVDGKSTFKEEFVTAGGVDLKEINFKTFESKLHPNLYFAGEVINVDALTGGFNFQNAWTGGYIAAQAIAQTK
ncbi:NAD(P)/FAD-dependent oxidoreductase [Arenibacter sp. GZD96]|uniref:NAD(P)/FAD-dependent oxidoreductase n=1 Tax=Aurantibrevibacter litoralis TaxID=3106030 RepID=UPI002AFE4CA3|nr:NAD(P)/FAD-dependent oxidoreductase [Arenibacter sp. GZD-96]MEA1785553.1 NAD(P)/FAD-dependent oxidoreductase [Arenibacter sp. GZD-96]